MYLSTSYFLFLCSLSICAAMRNPFKTTGTAIVDETSVVAQMLQDHERRLALLEEAVGKLQLQSFADIVKRQNAPSDTSSITRQSRVRPKRQESSQGPSGRHLSPAV